MSDTGEREVSHAGECPGCYYGVAPHWHDVKEAGGIIGSTRILPREEWPSNFEPDPEDANCGVYHCDACCACREESQPCA